jgi:hypothetical protein
VLSAQLYTAVVIARLPRLADAAAQPAGQPATATDRAGRFGTAQVERS